MEKNHRTFQPLLPMNLKRSSGTFRLPTGFYYINEQGQMEVQSVGFQGSHLFSAFVKRQLFYRVRTRTWAMSLRAKQ